MPSRQTGDHGVAPDPLERMVGERPHGGQNRAQRRHRARKSASVAASWTLVMFPGEGEPRARVARRDHTPERFVGREPVHPGGGAGR